MAILVVFFVFLQWNNSGIDVYENKINHGNYGNLGGCPCCLPVECRRESGTRGKGVYAQELPHAHCQQHAY